MNDQVCFRSDYFILFIVVTVSIIMWVIYQLYSRSAHELQLLYKDMSELVKSTNNTQETPTTHEISPSPIMQLPTKVIQPPIVTPIYPYDVSRYGDYQLVGYVHPHRHPDQMFRLMGRRYDYYKYEYYVIHPYTDIKIPIDVKNNWELNTGDHVEIPGFKGHYDVYIYDTDRQIQ